MKNIFESAKDNPLFEGISPGDFDKMINCLDPRQEYFKTDEVVLLSGDPINAIGLVLSGSVLVVKEDEDGKQNLLTEVSVSEVFGEVFACVGISHSPVSVIAAQDCGILFINYRKIISTCSSSCLFHTKLIGNMLKLIAQKNLMLNQKIEILSKRTIRERLLLFFSMQRGSSKKFTLPYNREELAQFLCVDRSAVSNELGKMRDEGLIRFHKNEFEIC